MLPRVALEYGQRSCATATSSSASAWESAGTSTSSLTARPKRPLPSAPMSTRAVTVAPSTTASSPSRRAEERIALAKQAAYPAAKSCSGLVPSPPGPPIDSGVVILRSSTPSSVRERPLRPWSVAVATGVESVFIASAWRISGASQEPHRKRADTRAMNSTTPSAHRVLVVDDEPNIVDVIAMALRFQGFTVESAGTGADALRAVAGFKPDLLVLDVMLPDMEGFEVARRPGAQRARVPIIFLTARDDTDDKVRGLSLGGDDYVTKPFSLEELVARIRSILRRSGLAEADAGRLVFEDLELDEDAHEVMRGGSHVDLTATEYRLLRYLMLNPRRVLTRAQLLEHVWDYDFGGDARVLETYISYLRRKLDVHGPPLIHTVRGVGYALRTPRA